MNRMATNARPHSGLGSSTHPPAPSHHPPEPIDGLVAVAIQLDDDHTISDRSELVNRLFSGVSWEGKDNITWYGQKFTAVRNDTLRKKLFQLLGCGLDLQTVDRNINDLLQREYVWLEAKSDDTVVIKSGEITAELDQICQMILSSLNRDLVTKLRLLIENVHKLLTSETYFGQTSHIDVNLFQSSTSGQLTVVHTRYFSSAKQRGIRALFLGGAKRSIEINFALRKVGISRSFAEDIISEHPTVIIRNGKLETTQLTEPMELQIARSAPPPHSIRISVDTQNREERSQSSSSPSSV